MYNSAEIAERIKAVAKSKGIPVKKMLEDSKNLTLLDAGIHIKSAMNETNMEELDVLV